MGDAAIEQADNSAMHPFVQRIESGEDIPPHELAKIDPETEAAVQAYLDSYDGSTNPPVEAMAFMMRRAVTLKFFMSFSERDYRPHPLEA